MEKKVTGASKHLRKDLIGVEELRNGRTIKTRLQEQLQKKYWIKEKGLITVSEKLKQKITAKSAKITKYQARVDQFRQNRLFRENQSRFCDELNGGEKNEIQSEKEGTIEFWKDIWSKPTWHNENAEWLHNLKEEIKLERENDVVITREMLEKVVNKMPNWKSPGPDLVQGFWLKRFTNLHERITLQLNECLREGKVPTWMTKGRTVLIVKDPQKGRVPSSYRPIACLAMWWKLLTGILAGEIYSFMED